MHRLVFGGESFIVLLYGAMNVYGLIGSECNGIAVLWENKGKAIILEHARDNSYLSASKQQRNEYARICAMDAGAFRTFVNDHPKAKCQVMVAKPEPILRPDLDVLTADFRTGRFAAAEEKSRFLVALVEFLCNHCDRDRFTRLIYAGLSQHLGHIAHYNEQGFYENWFEDHVLRVLFLRRHMHEQTFGEWRDVGNAFKRWVNGTEGQTVLHYYVGAVTVQNKARHETTNEEG